MQPTGRNQMSVNRKARAEKEDMLKNGGKCSGIVIREGGAKSVRDRKMEPVEGKGK